MRHHHHTTAAVLTGVFVLSLFLLTCDRELGQNPVGVPIDDDIVIIDPDTGLPPDSVGQNMSIGVDPNPVATSDLSVQTTITVHAFDNNRNPLAGKEIRFRSDAGLIYPRDTTDANGRAQVPYFSSQSNGPVRVYAQMTIANKAVTVSREVIQTGTSIQISPARTLTLVSDTVLTSIRVIDGTGKGVANARLSVSGAIDTSGQTAGDGLFWTRVRSARSTDNTVTVSASSVGAQATKDIEFKRSLTQQPGSTDDRSSFMRIYSASTQLKADNSDKTTITVLLLNDADLRNPATGRTIRFRTTLGSITQTAVIDSTGRATAILRSEPTNGTATVTATSDQTSDSASTQVVFGGVRVELSSTAIAQEVNNAITFTAQVRDGSDNLIGNQAITFFINENSVGTFDNEKKTYATQLDPTGSASATVVSGTAGYCVVNAMALSTSDSLSVQFTTNRLTIESAKERIAVGGAASTVITATYVDGSRAPVAGATVQFSTNAGTLTAASAVTNAQGKATTTLGSADFAATATVEARTSGGSARVTVEFIASTPASIELYVTPDNIPITNGVATLKAVVRDSNGNLVNAADVNFVLRNGPGDKEYIENPVVTTNNGVAYNKLFAGKVPSQYRSVEVIAQVGAISASTKLTISGEPYLITVSVPESDTVTVPDGGELDESTMEMFVGAVVQDINGNPVADGTEVHFSAVVSGMSVAVRRFVRWEFTDTDIIPIVDYRFIDVPFEDINNNLRMDPNIDLSLDNFPAVASRGDDVNGDGANDYDITQHDFFWFFDGPEPYWPASVEYFIETDPSKPNYRSPDTAIVSSVQQVITPTIAPGGASVTYDTSYAMHYDTSITFPALDSTYSIYADLNKNGRWDRTNKAIDHNNNGIYDGPASGDFQWWRWEMRPYWEGQLFDFSTNEFAVVVPASAQTTGGVAYGTLTYPRQLARRLYVTVNAEANGKRDGNGERVLLPIIR